MKRLAHSPTYKQRLGNSCFPPSVSLNRGSTSCAFDLCRQRTSVTPWDDREECGCREAILDLESETSGPSWALGFQDSDSASSGVDSWCFCQSLSSPPPHPLLIPSTCSWGPQLMLYWKEKSLQSIVFHAITRALPHCLCLWIFLFLPFHVYGFPCLWERQAQPPSFWVPPFYLSRISFFHTSPFLLRHSVIHYTALSFLPFYRNRNLFWLIHPLPSQCSISPQVFQLHGFCLYTLTSFAWFFPDSRSKKEHKYKETDIQMPTFRAAVAIMCI